MNGRVPSQPIFEWKLGGRRPAGLPSLLDLPHRVFTRSGRSAITLALQTIGLEPGERVLVPTYHCPTMISPVEFLGGAPAFYPINESGLPDLAFFEALPDAGIRAALLPHLFGIPRDLRAVIAQCRARGIAVIEDCAHCFYGESSNGPVGSQGDFAIGSLPKFFPVIEGGVLTAKAPFGAFRLSSQRVWGRELRAIWDILDLQVGAGRGGVFGSTIVAAIRSGKPDRVARTEREDSPVESDTHATRSQSLQDPLLQPAPLRSVERIIVETADGKFNVERRRANYRAIIERIQNVDGLIPLNPQLPDNCAPYVVPLHVDDADHSYLRMRQAGLPVFRWDRKWPETPASAADAATAWSTNVVQVACHQSLQESEIDLIGAALSGPYLRAANA